MEEVTLAVEMGILVVEDKIEEKTLDVVLAVEKMTFFLPLFSSLSRYKDFF